MGLWTRFTDPETEILKVQLAGATAERDWYRDRCGEMVDLLRLKGNALTAEIKRNRTREDLLTNQLLELGGGRRLPVREPDTVIEIPEDKGGAGSDEAVLRERAHEILEQQHPGEDVTADMLENALVQMRQDPTRWLND